MNRTTNPYWDGCLTRFGCVGFFLIIILVIGSITRCSYKTKEPEKFTQDLEAGTKAYVDIVMITPVYGESSSDSAISTVNKVFCKCITEDDTTVWIRMSTSEYNENIDEDANLKTIYGAHFDPVHFPDGIRIQGKVSETEDYDGAYGKIKVDTFLNFEEIIDN